MVGTYKPAALKTWRALPAAFMVAAWVVMHGMLAPLAPFTHGMPMLLLSTLVCMHMQGLPRINALVLFLLGLAHDAATGLPLGVTAALLVMVDVLLAPRAAEYREEAFPTRYAYVCVWLSVSLLGYFLLASFLSRAVLPLPTLLLTWLLTLLTYPLLHRILHFLALKLYRRVWIFLPQDLQGYK